MTLRWPTRHLVSTMGGYQELDENLQKRVDRANENGGFNDIQADRAAIACGYHPSLIWTDWFDAALRQEASGSLWEDRDDILA